MEKSVNAFIKQAPKVEKKDIEKINGLFNNYLFRRQSTREIWTTCCRRHRTLPQDSAFWNEIHVREERPDDWYRGRAPKKNETECPFCGRKGTVKDLKYAGRRQNLWELQRFVLLRWKGEALWAYCAEAKKDYTNLNLLTAAPMVKDCALYRFSQESVEYMIRPWYGEYRRVYTEKYSDFKKPLDRPFGWSAQNGLAYHIIGEEDIAKSPIRYCQSENWIAQKGEITRFLHVAYAFPRQTEMLMKAGMIGTVEDRAERGVKHYTVLDWNARDFRSAFKVPPEIIREFLRIKDPESREIGLLEMWKSMNRKRRVNLEELTEAYPILKQRRLEIRLAKDWGLDPMRLYRYLDGQNHCQVSSMFEAWRDYVSLGEKQGLRLYRSDVIMPENLGRAHDAVVAEHNQQLQRERDRKAAEQRTLKKAAEAGYETKLRKLLEKRYSWTAGEYCIIVPRNKEEILEEGRALQHCVGGYAERHIQGKTAILFMRRVNAPATPWITIEMDGARLVQIHGFKNENRYSSGKKAPDPQKEYADWLAPWLTWVKDGSRRKKDGSPIIPKSQNKEEGAA